MEIFRSGVSRSEFEAEEGVARAGSEGKKPAAKSKPKTRAERGMSFIGGD